jgi:AraC-like DNA-binding protein
MLLTWLPHWISLGLGLAVLYLLPLWWRQESWSRLLAGCVLALGLIQLHVLQTVLGTLSLPVLLLHELALYCVAPLLFLCVQSLLGNSLTGKLLVLHLAPLSLIACLAALQIARPEWLLPVEKSIYGASFAAGSVYALLVLKRLGQLAQPASLARTQAVLMALIVITGLAAALLVVMGVALEHPGFPYVYGSAITALLAGGYLLYERFPALVEVIGDELREAAEAAGLTPDIRRSQLAGINVNAKLAELHQQLEGALLYREEGLTSAQLATAVGLTPHQLSELVNEHLGINIPRLIKQHRIAEARKLLVERPAMSVLEVGLTVGFSSLSSFYTAFREFEGIAPGMYRKQTRARAKAPD